LSADAEKWAGEKFPSGYFAVELVHRTSFIAIWEKVPVAGGRCILDFRFVPESLGTVYRF